MRIGEEEEGHPLENFQRQKTLLHVEENETLPPELRIMSLGRSGKSSPPPVVRNCSRKLPDFMFGDGSELPSRSRNYDYVWRRTREEGEGNAPASLQKQETLLRVEENWRGRRGKASRKPPEAGILITRIEE